VVDGGLRRPRLAARGRAALLREPGPAHLAARRRRRGAADHAARAARPLSHGAVREHRDEEGPIGPRLPGRATARRAVQRALRPYASRQEEVDAALQEALADFRAAGAARLGLVEAEAAGLLEPPLLPINTVEADTVLGPLWLAAEDTLITPLIQQYGFWEPDVAAFFEARLRPGMRFVDVGANLGYFSVLASRLVGPAGQVVAVEPGERSGAVLRANLWRHGCRNTVVVPAAAWHESGHVQFEINPDGGSGDWVNPYERRGEATVVAAAALDDVLEGPVHGVKVDAQGADHLVLRGMARTLAMSPDVEIVVEFLPTLPNLYGDPQLEVLAEYRAMGFELYFLDPVGNPTPVTEEQVMGTGADIINLCLRRPGRP
jgi:FkbM family methyltransferase